MINRKVKLNRETCYKYLKIGHVGTVTHCMSLPNDPNLLLLDVEFRIGRYIHTCYLYNWEVELIQ